MIEAYIMHSDIELLKRNFMPSRSYLKDLSKFIGYLTIDFSWTGWKSMNKFTDPLRQLKNIFFLLLFYVIRVGYMIIYKICSKHLTFIDATGFLQMLYFQYW